MRRSNGFLRVRIGVFRIMFNWALNRHAFLWILLAAPVTVWLLPGQATSDFMPLFISCTAYSGSAAFISGWLNSATRKRLASLLFPSKSGKTALIMPEVLLPFLAGAIPSLGLAALWSSELQKVPWQLWAVIPFASLSAVSITVILERYLKASGSILNLIAYMSQGTSASWTSSPVFQILVPHGYVLWTLRWIQGNGAAFHGDIYVFLSVIEGIVLLILAARILSE